MAKTSVEIRDSLVDALALDLVGPSPGHALERETLEQPPSRWYLTGFLVPTGASLEQRSDEGATEQPDLFDARGGTDDAETSEPPAARRVYMPSSLGISLIVPSASRALDVEVTWGDYQRVIVEAQPTGEWRRTPRSVRVGVSVDRARAKPTPYDVPDSRGLQLLVSVRSVPKGAVDYGVAPPGGARGCHLPHQRTGTDCRPRERARPWRRRLVGVDIERCLERERFVFRLRVLDRLGRAGRGPSVPRHVRVRGRSWRVGGGDRRGERLPAGRPPPVFALSSARSRIRLCPSTRSPIVDGVQY